MLADDPGLLAFADALFSTQRRLDNPQQRAVRRRWWRYVALALAAAIGLIAIVLVAPWRGDSSLVDRALGAVGNGPVLHVVVELPPQSKLIDLKSGAERPLSEEREIWYESDRRIEHTVDRLGGVALWDRLVTPGQEITTAGLRTSSQTNPTIEPALKGFVDGYRQALASGAARQTETGTLDGVNVAWLSFKLAGGDREDVAVAVDSGRPLLAKVCSGSCWTYRIKTIETLPVDAANFRRPVESKAARDLASGFKNDRNVAAVDARSLPGSVEGAVWAGDSIQGLPLAGVTRENYRTTFGDGAAEDWSGAQLVYGAMSSVTVPDWQRPFIQLWEAVQPHAAFLGAPGGLSPYGVGLTSAATQLPKSELDGRLFVPWNDAPTAPTPPLGINALTGVALVNDVYVTIRASSGELLMAAARALHPIR